MAQKGDVFLTYRAEDTLTAQTKGHGLGLSIVKSLVELNGGSISVSSEVGKGSIFTVTFPTLVHSPVEESRDSAVDSSAMRSPSLTS